MVFLKKILEKRIFRVFHLSSLISQSRDQIQGPWFRIIYKRFVGYLFAKKWRQSFFRLRFLGKKERCKKIRIFFSFVAHISQHWRKIQKPFFLKTKSKDVGFFCTNQVFVIKYDAFVFLLKILDFFEKSFSVLFYSSLSICILYIRTENEYGVHGFVICTRVQ